jgi:FKBP12-rapamycin complex-associated protein
MLHMLPNADGEVFQDVNNEILECYLLATRYDGQWYKAWHTWALANFEVVNYLESHSEPRLGDVPSETLVPHTVQAVQGQ